MLPRPREKAAEVSLDQPKVGLGSRVAPPTGRTLHVGATCRLLVLLLLALPCSVEAATFTVDTTVDDPALTACDDAAPNDCSLRGAILAANGRPLPETSTIDVPAGTYVLSQSSSCTYQRYGSPTFFTSSQVPLCVAKNVALQGVAAAATIIDGNRAQRVFFISANATAQLSNITIAHGRSDRSFGLNPNGGGIVNEGTLTLTDSVVRDNSLDPAAGATGGGGIFNTGVLALQRSAVSDNLSPSNDLGGGILNYSQAVLTVSDSAISDNVIGGIGGGICNVEGVVTITNSTISGNTANGSGGGGITSFGGNFIGTLTVVNSTISNNTSDSSGGGINVGSLAETHLNNVTITANACIRPVNQGGCTGGGVSGPGISLQNTLIAGNDSTNGAAAHDCSGSLDSRGYNLIEITNGCVITGDTTGNITGVDAKLGVLADNGGFTQTHGLGDGSPAVDAGNPAAPGSGGAACAATDQRGFLRPLGAACDMGASERARTFSLAKVLPSSGGNTGSVSTLVTGSGFVSGATVTLKRAGQPDIVGSQPTVDAGGSVLATTFDLTDKSLGSWDVVVKNPDEVSSTLAGGFAIEEGRAPQLWVDVIDKGVRAGRPSKLTIAYGNRGNVDALAVPLSISVPGSYGLSTVFDIAPPPPLPDQVNVDWNQVPVIVEVDAQQSSTSVPLMLPVVPAGFTGTLQIVLLIPPEATAGTLFVGIDSPYFNPTLDPQILSGLVQGAQAYAQQSFNVTIPSALVPDLEEYVTNQLQLVVDKGRNASVASLGTSSQVYSLSQIQIDAALFGGRLALANGQASIQPHEILRAISTASRLFGALVSELDPAAEAQQANCPIVVCDPKTGKAPGSGLITPGCFEQCTKPNEIFLPPPIPAPPGCDPVETMKQLESLTGTAKLVLSSPDCKLTKDHCDALPDYRLIVLSDGGSACVPKKCPSNSPLQGCRPYEIDPKKPRDPNDKAGPLGTTAAQFLADKTPLTYTVSFENLKTATASAQEVVITDQLDVGKLALDTLSLGPTSFGDITVTPAPGVQEFTGGVDLRPDQNLIVTIQTTLDKDTGLLTWRFTSIDPETGQLPEDPDAGFLPPDVNPPAGDGSVSFTVQPQASVATGTTICNQASIIFDVNAPIDTPAWCNTFDTTLPTSQVGTLPATQPTTSFPVQWAGADQGAGIAGYTLFVSVNDGPYAAVEPETTGTTTIFTGEAGKQYAFYTVARDLAGNAELPPPTFDTRTVVLGPNGPDDLAITKLSVPKTITLRTGKPPQAKQIAVQIQNRSPHAQTIADATTLGALAHLTIESLGACISPVATLHPPKKFPLVVKPKTRVKVAFDVTFACANNPKKSGKNDQDQEDYRISAVVDTRALGASDVHPDDDACPRPVAPPGVVDAYPDRKILDKGCGARKANKTFGDPVLVDVVVKRSGEP